METKRLSESTTGNLRKRSLDIILSQSDSLSVSRAVRISFVIISLTAVIDGSSSSATTRRNISRSVIKPKTSFLSLTITMEP